MEDGESRNGTGMENLNGDGGGDGRKSYTHTGTITKMEKKIYPRILMRNLHW
ncbi:hypothetical protein Scep_016395 [Stephania cephalantha]|uniref:Uncharacterized protein n=1 Tax=Stephania cephalantha TaxID=152367 RepID=A0AAP0IMR8_9MAGN